MADEASRVRARLREREQEVDALRSRLERLEQNEGPCIELVDKVTALPPLESRPLSNQDILRYSRQLLLPELGVRGQQNLSQCSVLVVGCGGLGCPLAQYLAAAGIGRLGLLDYDEVELSNLHRQVLHREQSQGQAKALSAATAVSRLNSTVECIPYHMQLTSQNALQLIQQYDIVADCSDNVPTRYLVNDACVMSRKPLVSASALRLEGQLTVYNYGGGPCYRCLFPVPPPAHTVTNCSDGGVLGVVPGIMGCLQALEVIKIATGQGSSCGQQLVMFDALDCRFRSIRLRPRQTGCAVCGENPSVTQLLDYEALCGSAATDKCRRLNLLTKQQRVTVQSETEILSDEAQQRLYKSFIQTKKSFYSVQRHREYKAIVDQAAPHLLLDVRPPVEVDICQLPFSLNIPLSSLQQGKTDHLQLLKERISQSKGQMLGDGPLPVYVICKLGNDSQKAVQLLEEMSASDVDRITVKDVSGGLVAWSQRVDPTFPQY